MIREPVRAGCCGRPFLAYFFVAVEKGVSRQRGETRNLTKPNHLFKIHQTINGNKDNALQVAIHYKAELKK